MQLEAEETEVRDLFVGVCREFDARFVALPDKPEETAEATVRALWLRAAGQRVSGEKAMEMVLPPLSIGQVQELKGLLERRLAGTPLAHLTERQSFMGLEFICTNAALIPRKETELLARAACRLLQQEILPVSPIPRVLDLCCGSGNVACVLASRIPHCIVMAADLSLEALEVAKENARSLAVADRVVFKVGDLFLPFESDHLASFDLITCNPPYITTGKLASLPSEIREHEPKLAFDGGPLGVGVLWRLWQEAPRFLKPSGWLAFEVGLGQGPQMLQRLSKSAQYTNVKGIADKAGNPRTIVCQLAGQPVQTK